MTIFTIVTRSYLPLAYSLFKSYDENSSNKIVKYIIVVDYDSDINLNNNDAIIISAKDVLEYYNLPFQELSFKYDVTEFSTAIKPFAIKYLKDINDCSKMIYLDPDILFFNSVDLLENYLEDYKLIVTPHFVEITDNIKEPNRFLGSGVYNLGFLGLDASDRKVMKFVDWWGNRCLDFCFRERDENLFTDQKWFDLIPCFFSHKEFCVLDNIGFNVAPWNLHERDIFTADGKYFVRNLMTNEVQQLVFFHFSGFNYKNLINNKNEKFKIDKSEGLCLLSNVYQDYLNANEIYRYINIPYKYNYFNNGNRILKFHRRVYRAYIKENALKDPFECKKLSRVRFKEENIDSKTGIDDLNSYNLYVKIIYVIANLFRSLIGFANYVKLLKFTRTFSRFENQCFIIFKDSDEIRFWN